MLTLNKTGTDPKDLLIPSADKIGVLIDKPSGTSTPPWHFTSL
ncbi:hypothetical protein [Tropicibacter sp. R16_0]|nr:hypothetical protein [Tropicibacter sp. R16_0]